MKIIFGASGFAKEIDFLLHDNNSLHKIDYFIDLISQNTVMGVKVISEEYFGQMSTRYSSNIIAYVGIGSPDIREKIHQKFGAVENITFPNAIHNSVIYDKRDGMVVFGAANIICSSVTLTTSVKLGFGNHINLDCTVGHDTEIGDFNTISPGVHLSGNVRIGSKVFIGTGATVLEKVSIPNGTIIGAGSVVTRSIVEAGTYVGIPAKRIK